MLRSSHGRKPCPLAYPVPSFSSTSSPVQKHPTPRYPIPRLEVAHYLPIHHFTAQRKWNRLPPILQADRDHLMYHFRRQVIPLNLCTAWFTRSFFSMGLLGVPSLRMIRGRERAREFALQLLDGRRLYTPDSKILEPIVRCYCTRTRNERSVAPHVCNFSVSERIKSSCVLKSCLLSHQFPCFP